MKLKVIQLSCGYFRVQLGSRFLSEISLNFFLSLKKMRGDVDSNL